MRKAERLFQIITLLRGRRTVLTAHALAELLEVSERTIYRDIQALSLSGVPIEGEAGVGYRLQRHFDLPPLMFDRDEIDALLVGARMVQAWSDKSMATKAMSALQKILSVLPPELRHSDEDLPIIAPDFYSQREYTRFKEEIRSAIKHRNILSIDYRCANDELSKRQLQPLGLVFWGKSWTLVAHCLLRQQYRMFRLDRVLSLTVEPETFLLEKTKSMDHYLLLEKQRCQDYDNAQAALTGELQCQM